MIKSRSQPQATPRTPRSQARTLKSLVLGHTVGLAAMIALLNSGGRIINRLCRVVSRQFYWHAVLNLRIAADVPRLPGSGGKLIYRDSSSAVCSGADAPRPAAVAGTCGRIRHAPPGGCAKRYWEESHEKQIGPGRRRVRRGTRYGRCHHRRCRQHRRLGQRRPGVRLRVPRGHPPAARAAEEPAHHLAQPAEYLRSDAGVRRGAEAEQAGPVLPDRHQALPAERLYQDHQRDQRRRCAHRHRAKSRPADDRRGPRGGRAQAGAAHRPEQPGCVHRHVHRHLGPVRHQQRIRLVRGLDDPRRDRPEGRGAAAGRPRHLRHHHRRGRRQAVRHGQRQQQARRDLHRGRQQAALPLGQ